MIDCPPCLPALSARFTQTRREGGQTLYPTETFPRQTSFFCGMLILNSQCPPNAKEVSEDVLLIEINKTLGVARLGCRNEAQRFKHPLIDRNCRAALEPVVRRLSFERSRTFSCQVFGFPSAQ
jgi:hypothetical protein